MKGARAVVGWMLILIAVCLLPAVSAAQGTETATAPEPAADLPEPAADPPEPAADPPERAADPVVEVGEEPADAQPAVEQQLQAEPAPSPPPAAPGPHSSKAKASASAKVTMGDFFFSPASVSVAVGDTVTWSNSGQAPHNATADDGSFKTRDLNNGQSASHKFTSGGTFSYICTIHPNMTGTVRVLAASGGGSGGGGASGPSTTATGESEAAAVASPDAAGTSTTLPATGMAAGVLALVGLALVASGSLVGRAGGTRDRRSRFLTIF